MIYTNCNTNSYLDPFFDAFFGKDGNNYGRFNMKTNVYESEKAYRLDIEMPGFTKENISLDFKDGYLTVGVKSEEKEEDEFKLLRRERFYGEVSRQYYLGEVDEKAITASYKDGILSIVAPKVQPEEAKPTRIAIQ